MASSKLPDEMLQEFLAPTLSVPDEMFSSTAMESPFSSVSQSSSALLLICKGWLRVGTPLLYRTVVLRSLPQAQALADSLQTNPALGRHIKKLRVEGGYGIAMHKILTSAPNISDLYLSLFIWSDDSVSGLCRSLSAISPSRVILHDDLAKAKFNAKIRQLTDTLCKCIPQWKNLVNFHFPYHRTPLRYLYLVTQRSSAIAAALRKAPNLEFVSAPPGYMLPDDFITISGNPSLKTIRIKGFFDRISTPFLHALELESNAKIRALITFDEEPVKKPEPIQQQVETPHIRILPLHQAPREVQDQVWSEIIGFALTTPDLRLMNGHQKSAANAWMVTLLLVSKTFYRLALPHFYGHPIVLSRNSLGRFSERLIDDPSLGLHLRSFFVWRPFLGESFHTDAEKADNNAIKNVFSRSPRLTRVYGVSQDNSSLWLHGSAVTWEMFCLLGATAGSSLLEFESISICDAPKVRTPCPLHSFTRIRSLYWDCHAIVDANDNSLRECLPLLESLHISVCDPSFLKLLSRMHLPALSRLEYNSSAENAKALLLKHGPKLRELKLLSCHGLPIFDMCPSLNVLSFNFDLKNEEFAVFCCNVQHRSLKKVVIFRKSWVDKPDYDKFFAILDLTLFPALREMRVEECEWPTDLRKISKSTWVTHSEALLKSGVTLTDRFGRAWRHRLKRSK